MSMQTHKMRVFSLLLALVLFSALLPVQADGARFGRVNYNQVRFRKTASSAEGQEWWSMLDAGWVVEILGESANNYGRWYQVTCVIPEDPTHSYVGYVMRQYVTEMSAQEISAWLNDPVQPGMESAVILPDPMESPASYGTINTGNVFFRKSPSFSAGYWALLPEGYVLHLFDPAIVTKDGIEWYHVYGTIPADESGTYDPLLRRA